MTVVVMNNHNNQLSAVGDAVGTTCKVITNIRVNIIYTAHVRSEQSLSNYEVQYTWLFWKGNPLVTTWSKFSTIG